MKPLGDCRLYTFVDTAYLHGRDPADVARQLCDGGADIVQFRAKDWTPEAIRRVAGALAPIAGKAGVWLVINDHPEIASEVGAPLAHLGQEDFFDAGHTHAAEITSLDRARRELPLFPQREERTGERRALHDPQHDPLSPSEGAREPLLLGLSTHSPAQAERALLATPGYIAIGPVFATPTKPGRPGVTLEYVRWAAKHVPIPWFAIGGITLQNLDDVLKAGATRVCVVSDILNAPDIARACRAFKDRLTSAASA